IGTLIVTRGRTARWRLTRLWYATTWRATRALVLRIPEGPAELLLNIYPALSLLGLLLVWLVTLMLGWALVYWGLDVHIAGAADWGGTVAFAGSSLLAPSYATVRGAGDELLTLLETVTGLGTIALLISYLPALYGAYSRREARLLTLDDPGGGRLTPVGVIAGRAAGRDVEQLYRFCAEWEMWTAEVLESHVSYPMLALFRSQHAGQSWITALGVVTDAATLSSACIEGADRREPYFLSQRGRRAVVDIAARLHVPHTPATSTWLVRDNFELAWGGLAELEVPLRDREEAWQRLQDLRAPYGQRLEELIEYLVAPHGFWGHSAEGSVAREVALARAEARARREPRA
ncbi:MAG TPA: hypothetical protein VFO60_09760, partial [Candidatus Dormibacteraeota bacterium]|nr:hypothetical protein [Candidatus Dormibacteraeota bacterium]